MDVAFFRALALTKGLSHAELTRLTDRLETKRYGAGDRLCVEGALGEGLMLVREGTVKVLKKTPSGAERTLVRLHAPTVLGEMELVSGTPSAASVLCESEVTVELLPGAAFDQLLESGDSAVAKLMRNIARVLAGRLTETNEHLVRLLDPQRMEEFHALQGQLSTRWTE